MPKLSPKLTSVLPRVLPLLVALLSPAVSFAAETSLQDEILQVDKLINNGLSVLHLELDQYPEKHVYTIATKP